MEGNKDSIVALSTPKGRSALAVIRISGPTSSEIFSTCVQEVDKVKTAKRREIHCYKFLNNAAFVDEITAIKYSAPHSFTGEDMIELLCHGSPLVIDQILSVLCRKGARAAMKGEFTRRAFLNGKIDLLRAESIRNIIDSLTSIELESARHEYQGAGVRKIEEFRGKIVDAISHNEAIIEFEEEDDIRNIKDSTDAIAAIIAEIEKEITIEKKFDMSKMGVLLTIAGPPNSGKSSLFNSLVGSDQSIVHHTPGTTRDVIKQNLVIRGVDVEIVDCAGVRDTDNEIEKMGIGKAKEVINNAQILLWISSNSEEIQDREKEILQIAHEKPLLFILNKIDLPGGCPEKERWVQEKGYRISRISVQEKKNIEEVRGFIEKEVGRLLTQFEFPTIIHSKRQQETIVHINEELKKALQSGHEIKAHYLRNALMLIDEILGKTTTDNILDKIFDSFCVGK